VLELIDLTRRYGETLALDGLSFSVPSGQVLGFLGPNGAGKTTAMRIVMGVARPDSGEVRWRGEPAGSAARRAFGYMPEARGLYPRMRVAEQLRYLAELRGVPRAEAEARAGHWLERLGLAGRAGSRVEELSHGNQQRAQLAAALVHDPEVLVLDEPFSGLDPIGVDAMSEVLRQRAADGCAVVFSSHQLDLVEHLCEAVAIINRGRLVMRGTMEELRAQGPRRLAVGVAGVGPAWAGRVQGAHIVGRDDGRVLLDLDAGTDPQRVLAAAQAAGRLTHFAEEHPPLSELFRRAVGG
jgi:ABC-2 type transport system ATP-binding protein